jgi:hypothetical protein
MVKKESETKLVQVILKGTDLEKHQRLKEYFGLQHDSEVLRVAINLTEKTLLK